MRWPKGVALTAGTGTDVAGVGVGVNVGMAVGVGVAVGRGVGGSVGTEQAVANMASKIHLMAASS